MRRLGNLLPKELFPSPAYSIVVLTFPHATMKQAVIRAFFFLLTLPAISAAQWKQTSWPNMTTVRSMTVEGNNIYVGGQMSGGISLSTDEGVTWKYMNSGLPTEQLYISALTHVGPTLFVSATGGIFRSVDSAKHWIKIDTLQPLGFAVAGSIIYGACSIGLFSSVTNGDSWQPITTGFTLRNVYAVGSKLFALTTAGLFFSDDNGANWVSHDDQVETSITCLTNIGSTVFIGTFFKNDIAAYSSINDGKNWSPINDVLLKSQINSAFTTNGRLFYGFNNGKVHFSDDLGGHWTFGSTGLQSSSVMVFAATEKTLFAGTYAGGVWSRPLSEFTTSDVKSIEAQKEITVFPNPTTGPLTISSSESIKQIEIVNALGEQVMTVSGVQSTIDMSQLSAGIYFARFSINNSIKNIAIFKE